MLMKSLVYAGLFRGSNEGQMIRCKSLVFS